MSGEQQKDAAISRAVRSEASARRRWQAYLICSNQVPRQRDRQGKDELWPPWHRAQAPVANRTRKVDVDGFKPIATGRHLGSSKLQVRYGRMDTVWTQTNGPKWSKKSARFDGSTLSARAHQTSCASNRMKVLQSLAA